ncbi:hypothetical protein, partial [Pontibacter harenae]|uniref:hypothetical protein n=1 Tax=Pontibacter harenae TaxID=2894083 RepID=UPI001E29D021
SSTTTSFTIHWHRRDQPNFPEGAMTRSEKYCSHRPCLWNWNTGRLCRGMPLLAASLLLLWDVVSCAFPEIRGLNETN